MHPLICSFISDLAYEGRLESAEGRDRQAVLSGRGLGGSGLRFIAVEHHGNRTSSEEEALAVDRHFRALVGGEWTDCEGRVHALDPKDILVVAPYNAQVSLLASYLPEGARVGTVDRFQGQEAPVVLVSFAASSAEEVPRGVEFLFSRNRLNVAVSRAQALAVIFASPRLLATSCRTVEQLALVNGLCRFVELAESL